MSEVQHKSQEGKCIYQYVKSDDRDQGGGNRTEACSLIRTSAAYG